MPRKVCFFMIDEKLLADIFMALVIDISFQQVWCEDAAFQQELVIFFQGVQVSVQIAGYRSAQGPAR